MKRIIGMRRLTWLLSVLLALAACDSRMYTRDGVTDGDAFFIPPGSLLDQQPDAQSWVAYSLGKSACQLQIGGANPARNSSFECEFKARRILVNNWRTHAQVADEEAGYLDELLWVADAGFLEEYVWHYLRRRQWQRPPDLDLDGFRVWRREQLRGHNPETRLIGSWYYRK